MARQGEFTDEDLNALVEQWERRQQELAEREYEKHLEAVRSGIEKGPIRLIARKAENCLKRTLDERLADTEGAFRIWTQILSRFEGLAVTTLEEYFWTTVYSLNEVIGNNAYSSIFLAINGEYESAMFLCRQWLELMFGATYFDSELSRRRKGTVTQREITEKKNSWLNGDLPWSGSFFANLLIDYDTDQRLCDFLAQLDPQWFDGTRTVKANVKGLYRKLSGIVHLGRALSRHEDELNEVIEFDESAFDSWYIRFRLVHDITTLVLICKCQGLSKLDDTVWHRCFSFDKEECHKYLWSKM